MKGERTSLKFVQKILVTLIMLVMLFPYFVFNISEATVDVPEGFYKLIDKKYCAVVIEDRYSNYVRSGEYDGNANIKLDQGTDLWVYFYDDEEYCIDVRGIYSATNDNASDGAALLTLENTPGQPICILAEYINDFDYLQSLYEKYNGYGTLRPHYQIAIRRKYTSAGNLSRVGIGAWYNIYPRRNSLYIAGSTENAAIKDGTLYIKPGAEIKITNAFREMDYEAKGYLENNTRGTGTYKESGAAIHSISSWYGIATVKASNRLGDTGYIVWENTAGASCSMPVVVSDLAASYFSGVYGQSNARVQANGLTEVWPSIGSTYVKRNIYTTTTSPSVVNVYTQALADGSSIDFDKFDFEFIDATGCLLKKNVRKVDDHYSITFVPKQAGIVTVKYTDYQGNRCYENWKIQMVSKAELSVKEDVQDTEEIEIGEEEKGTSGEEEAKKIATTTVQPPEKSGGSQGKSSWTPPSNYGNSGNNGSNGNSGNTGSSPQPTITYYQPSISYTSQRDGSDKITYHFTTSNATDALYGFRPRTIKADGSLSEFRSLSNNYSAEGGYAASNPASFSATLSLDEYDEGYYDMIMMAKNTYDNITNYVAEGPVALFKTPDINYTVKANGTELVTFDFNITNATNTKVLIRKREVDSNGKLKEFEEIKDTYSTFKGKEQKNPNKFSINLSAGLYKAGYFDVIVMSKNTDDDVSNCIAIGPNFLNNAPTCGITTVSVKSAANKTLALYSVDLDNDNVDLYYYIQKKETASEYKPVDKNTIIKNGKKVDKNAGITNAINLKADDPNTGIGYYDITVLAVDSNGGYSQNNISNIGISNSPTMVYQIEGEEGNSSDGYVSSSSTRNTQKVKLEISDKDANDNVKVYYFYTDEDYAEKEVFKNKEEFLKQGKNITTKSLNGNKGTLEIEILPDENKVSDKYLYVLLEDKYNANTFYKAGIFSVDGSKLELTGIGVVQEDNIIEQNKTTYSVDEEMKVFLQFNHKIAEKAPDLYIKSGNTEIKQDKIEYKDNMVIYTYKIKETTPSGYVSLSRFGSNVQFEDNYINKGTYSADNILSSNSNVINDITENKYYIDTQAPKINNLKIEYTKDSNSKMVKDDTNKKIYISKVADVKAVVEYNDTVSGEPLKLEIRKGDNYTQWVTSENSENRTKDEYSLIDVNKKANKYEGKYEILGLSSNITVKDLAGNKLNASDYNVSNVSYYLDGEKVQDGYDVIIDDTVSPGLITRNIQNKDEKITEKNEVYTHEHYTTGTIINCFSEYKNGNVQDYSDASGINKVMLQIYYNNSNTNITLYDKNNNVITSKDNANNTNPLYNELAQYTLQEDQLPVSFELGNVDQYSIVTSKTDKLGNKKEKSIKLFVTNELSINEELSGLKNLDNSQEFYNYFDLTEEQKEYTLAIKNESRISKDNIKINVRKGQNFEEQAEFVEQKTIDGVIYDFYKFNIKYGGDYSVEIVNTDSEEAIYNEVIDVRSVFKPGDANDDGKITVYDFVIALRYLARLIPHDDKLDKALDINNSGDFDVRDNIVLSRIVANDVTAQLDDRGYLK